MTRLTMGSNLLAANRVVVRVGSCATKITWMSLKDEIIGRRKHLREVIEDLVRNGSDHVARSVGDTTSAKAGSEEGACE